jgi:hypothetical protein
MAMIPRNEQHPEIEGNYTNCFPEVEMSRGNCFGLPSSIFCRPFALSRQCMAVTLALAVACVPTFAQSSAEDWSRVQTLPADTAISVKTKGGAKYHGDFVTATVDSLAIDSDEPAFPGRTVRRKEFAREEVQEIRLIAPAASLFAGAGIGAAVGAGIGIGLDSTAKSHEYRGLIAGLMAVLGAALGVAIAHHHPFVKGTRVYVAP